MTAASSSVESFSTLCFVWLLREHLAVTKKLIISLCAACRLSELKMTMRIGGKFSIRLQALAMALALEISLALALLSFSSLAHG